jgi:hypothetical protein
VNRLQLAIEQIVFARKYTIYLLDQTPMAEWFRQPPGGVSHVAWQVGGRVFEQRHPCRSPIGLFRTGVGRLAYLLGKNAYSPTNEQFETRSLDSERS